MKKEISKARTKARSVLKGQHSRLWILILDNCAQAFIINTQTKQILVAGPVCITPATAVEELTEMLGSKWAK